MQIRRFDFTLTFYYAYVFQVKSIEAKGSQAVGILGRRSVIAAPVYPLVIVCKQIVQELQANS